MYIKTLKVVLNTVYPILSPDLTNATRILREVWGYDSFRPLQETIIQSVLNNHDTLAVLPTGGGKSICFQIPGLLKDGICLVVSPLIALMKDQVDQLKQKGIPASVVHSGLSHREIDIILDNAVYGSLKFLYLSPERLQTDLFLARVKKMNVNLLAVDEAHCISQWGYDFRPPYLAIGAFRQYCPDIPVLALTASATPEVRLDIADKLILKKPQIYLQSFARENISYSVFYQENKERKILEILGRVSGPAIVYVRNRRKTKELADFLNKNRMSAEFYHAGLSHTERSAKQERWMRNQARIMVATNAFGMGINKPDVRVVINLDLPENLEAYYQEAGRGGRDGRKAYAVLLYNQRDIQQLYEKINDSYPEVEFIKKVYQCLANFLKVAAGSSLLASYDFDFDLFVENFKLPQRKTYHALKRMESQGLIEFNEAFFAPSRLFIPISHEELYRFQVKNEHLDRIIKLILRLYGGSVFSLFTTINEKLIARYLEISETEVKNALELLDKSHIVEYSKQKSQPQIVFLTPRLDAAHMSVDHRLLKERKELELMKARAAEAYAVNVTECRAKVIRTYFGETVTENCGKCDVCLEELKAARSGELLYKTGILSLLTQNDYGIQELVNKIDFDNPDLVIAEIRDLLDRGQIEYTVSGNLKISNK